MNLAELVAEVNDWLSFNPDVANTAFSAAQVKTAINHAYKRELRKARLEGGDTWFKKNISGTWPANTATFMLPSLMNQTNCLWIEDITDSDPGYALAVSNSGSDLCEVFWLDNKTLQWGSNGPGGAKTLRFHYMARAEKLVNDADVPELIPDDYHELIVLSAGVYLRFKADELAPEAWQMALQDIRIDYWKEISMGRPNSSGTQVRRIDPFADYDAPSQDRSSIASDQNS